MLWHHKGATGRHLDHVYKRQERGAGFLGQSCCRWILQRRVTLGPGSRRRQDAHLHRDTPLCLLASSSDGIISKGLSETRILKIKQMRVAKSNVKKILTYLEFVVLEKPLKWTKAEFCGAVVRHFRATVLFAHIEKKSVFFFFFFFLSFFLKWFI